MTKKKLKSVILLTLLFGLFASQTVFGQGTWGDARTFNLNRGDSWTTNTTVGARLSSYKQTSSTSWDAHTLSKTMLSDPQIRMVNSGGQIRSNSMSAPFAGRTSVGSGNTGEIGYHYYGSVRPARGQLGNDSIRLQLRAR